MSGICGAWTKGHGDTDIGPSLAHLERRGPDGTRQWSGGDVALGHTLLATTPEALVEKLPLTDYHSGCTITADARIDNREELIVGLGLVGETRTIGDGELILRAYLEWGEECPKHLLGDFAFGIWDPRAPHLFCARDHMGMRQLIYFHDPKGLFVFATNTEAVLSQTSVPKKINQGRIADYLEDLEGLDLTSTFFQNIFRLPAAHTLTVEVGTGLSVRRYWQLKPTSELKLPNDESYAAAFLEVLTEAVRCRLRSPKPIGSMLSGGMDSGSVAAIAARLLAANGNGPLLTFSAIDPDADGCVETRAIRSSAALPGLKPHFVSTEITQNKQALGISPPGTEPFDSHMTLVRAVYLTAHHAGVRIMLDGVAGDVVLTAGNRVAQLLRQARFVAAIKEARGEARFWGKALSSWKILGESAWAAFVPSPIRDLRRSLIARWHDAVMNSDDLIGRDFAKRIDLAARRKRHRRHIPATNLSIAEQRAQSITHPHMVVGRERYDRVASAMAIEPRDPFMDLRVVEFCLSLPPAQLQANGWPKIVLRRAMREFLPHDVVWRLGKEHLGWAFTKALFASMPGWEDELGRHQTEFDFFLNINRETNHSGLTINVLSPENRIKLFYLLKWLHRNSI